MKETIEKLSQCVYNAINEAFDFNALTQDNNWPYLKQTDYKKLLIDYLNNHGVKKYYDIAECHISNMSTIKYQDALYCCFYVTSTQIQHQIVMGLSDTMKVNSVDNLHFYNTTVIQKVLQLYIKTLKVISYANSGYNNKLIYNGIVCEDIIGTFQTNAYINDEYTDCCPVIIKIEELFDAN